MDILLQLNRAIEYIEDNINSNIDYNELAKHACSSSYHFSRMFSSISGITLSEYIRRRKLSLAAIDLQNSNKKIVNISMDYGYSSPDSFTRAFSKQHGITPTEARKNGENLKLYPRLTFQIKVKGDREMDYRIEKIDYEIKIVGKLYVIDNYKAKEQIPAEYAASHSNGLLEQLIKMAWENPKCQLESIIGVIGESSPINSETFNFIMGVRYEDSVDGMTSITIPPCTWAVFPNIEEAWKRLYTEWLPSSTYELADLPCLEHSLPPDRVPNNELWVPIKQK